MIDENEHKIKELVYNDLCIRRVPKKDLDWFKQYANEEYEGDYGMLLKELISFYRGMYSDAVLVKLDEIMNQLTKSQPQEQPEVIAKVVRMADGTERIRGA
jgi:hypothetical protein